MVLLSENVVGFLGQEGDIRLLGVKKKVVGNGEAL